MGGLVTLRAAVGAAAIALAATPANPADSVSVDLTAHTVGDPFAGITGLSIEYFDVPGRSAAELRASLARLGPIDPESGVRFDAYTRWHLYWRLPETPNGGCRLDKAEVMFKVNVQLPRLADAAAVAPAVLRRWQSFVAALKAHEGTHAREADEGRKALLRAFRAAKCSTVVAEAGAVLDAVERRSAEYDERTRHGLDEGVRRP